MITKTDIVLLLTELEKEGVEVKDDIYKVVNSPSIPLEVLKKINDSKCLDIINFYTKIRHSYNKKKSKLYVNIMKSDENILEDPRTILTTLSGLLNQILQFKADNQTLFYKHARADEISRVLSHYFKTYDLQPAIELLKITKADIKVLNMIK